MRKSLFSRAVCLTLAALLLILCGCGAQSTPTADPTPTVIVASDDADSTPAPELLASRAFQKHYYTLPGTLTHVLDVCTDEQYLYLLGEDSDSSRTQLWRMGLDGSGETQLHTFYELQSETSWQYHSRLLPQVDGGVWVQEVEGAESYVFPEGVTAESAGPERWDYYDHTDIVTRLYGFSDDGKAPTVTQIYSGRETVADLTVVGGNIVYAVDKTVRILAPDGKLLVSHDADCAVYGLTACGDALYAVTASDDGENAVVRAVDLADATLSESLEGQSSPFYYRVGTLDGGIVASQLGDLFLYQPETNETRKLVDWLDYGVDPFGIEKSYASDCAVVAVLYESERAASTDKTSLVVLTPSNTTVLPTGTLTVATLYPDSEIVDAVLAFNGAGGDRIRLVDYSEYDLFGQNAQAKLSEDLASSRCPDIVYSGSSELPADRLAEGKLLDLTPLLAADAELMREKLLPSALALLQSGDKLYALAPYFYLRTMIGREDVVGSAPLTIGKAAQLAAALPENGSICDFYLTRDAVFSDTVAQIADDLKTNGSYRFASQVFYDGLAYAKLFPAEIDWNRFNSFDYSGWARVRNGSQLIISDAYTDFGSLAAALHSVGDGVICGLPAVPGGHTLIFPLTIGITKECGDTDAAWQFVRTMMLASYSQQRRDAKLVIGFPTNETALDAIGEAAMTSEDTALFTTSDLSIEVSCRTTAQEYEAIRAAMDAAAAREIFDGTLIDVIAPSAEQYFTGALDAPRAAQAAQTAWDAIATTPR